MLNHLAKSAVRVNNIQKGMMLAQMRNFAKVTKFTKTHEWITYDTETHLARIGITDFAQKELGDIVHVEMPEVGDQFDLNGQIVAVESTKTAADVYIMVEGEIVGINDNVADDSSLVNTSPEQDGWMVEVKVAKPDQLKDLMDLDQYKEIIH